MISVNQALERIEKITKTMEPQFLPLIDCFHLVSAEDVFASFDVPSFDNSAMDGYAFRFEDFKNDEILKINNEIQAGASTLIPLKKMEVARIFTGAPIPENADTVIPQENVRVENGILKIDKEVKQGENIRLKGTQTRKGDLVLAKGTFITPEYMGFLATLGIPRLLVYTKPKIGIIVTGKELVPLDKKLEINQIYESNSVFLTATLQELDLKPEFTIWVDDDKETLKNVVQEKINSVDVLIFTGGISVGDYDFVKPVLEELGTHEIFYKVKQKPGKPLFFGTLNDTTIFALPGNPSAVVVCYHAYIKPFLKQKMGHQNFQKKHFGILINSYSKKAGLTHFVKAFVENNKVEILTNQLSYQMDTYRKANAIAVLKEEQEDFLMGEKIEIIPFRN